MHNEANFVQNEDSATFTLEGTGISQLIKSTGTLNSKHEFVYWSSPMSDLTLGDSPLYHNDRIYWHNASNYLDVEITGTGAAGSDDIDDNYNDWQNLGSSKASNKDMIITPGMGIIATHQSAATYPNAFDYTFTGTFNTGLVSYPVVYNAANTGGHWNLLGNPYPGALDFDAFVTHNAGVVDGVAHLWVHQTDAHKDHAGHHAKNYTAADYVILAAGSGSANNSPDTLLEYIPSGESFFIASLSNANAQFTNAMRVTNPTANTEISKTSTTKSTAQANKIWINLTSDTGDFNQVLMAYVDGATTAFDGFRYDAPKNLTTGLSSIIYTKIADKPDRKFAVQGRNSSDLQENEYFTLGFSVSGATNKIYTLSIGHLRGNFWGANHVLLKDNYLNTTHNLSDSDYNFSSQDGEFEDRFEVVFQSQVLSNTDWMAKNKVFVKRMDKNLLLFETAGASHLKNIAVFDLLGRKIQNLDCHGKKQSLSTSQLQQAVYIAEITLENNQVITKKISL